MTEPLRRSATCLDAETLAALIDGRLEPIDRDQAQVHLTTCGDCYEAFVEAGQLAEKASHAGAIAAVKGLPRSWEVLSRWVRRLQGGQATGSPWKRRVVWYGAPAAIAAAVIAVMVVRPFSKSPEAQLDIVINDLAAAATSHRLTEGRLSGPFAWAPIPSVTRASGADSLPVDIEVQARRLQVLAPSLPPAQREHALGIALLAQGDIDGAVMHLTAAVDISDGNPRALVDLSAALLERWRQRGHRADAQNAKNRAEAALSQNPANAEAAFNVALAAESLGLKDEAIKAWSRCASLYPTSKWALEARARTAALARKD